ncbi:MAG: type II secretion system minor pseudopilin GspH [Gammaproteobacteria bacterium]|nr:type II secretion system minor pseudopilin GspH [Gammaproteobacteria bacterium]
MRTSKSGFTLIEILVVVVILAITASMALMAFGDFGESQRIEAEAERFTHKLRLIRYHAILEATPYQVQIFPSGYQVLRFIPPNRWKKTTSSELGMHAFPKKIQTYLQLHQSSQKNAFIIQASGEITPFTLTFGAIGKSAIIQVDTQDNGKITLKKISGNR